MHDEMGVNAFAPEEVTRIYEAYAAALAEIGSRSGTGILQPRDLRRLVASGVIAEARRGETAGAALQKAGVRAADLRMSA